MKCTLKIGISLILSFSLLFSGMIFYKTEVNALNTTYYVDSVNGNDGNIGTNINYPVKTIAKVNSIQLLPGDQVLFKAGCYWEGVIVLNASGNSTAQIVFGRYGTGSDPIIDAKRVQTHTFIATDKDYFTVENLQLRNTSTLYGTGNVIRVELKTQRNLNHIRVSNITITGPDGTEDSFYCHSIYFILYESAYPYHFNDVVVSGCNITDIWGNGIVFEKVPEATVPNTQYKDSPTSWSTNVIIENNYINNTGVNGITIACCNGPIVQYNTVGNVGQMQVGHPHEFDQWFCGVWGYWCKDSIYQYNEVYNTAIGAGDGSAFDTDWGNAGTIIHQYNYSHDNAGGFKIGPATQDSPYLIADIIRYNISENDGSRRTILIDDGVTKIYNNVFYNEFDPIKLIRTGADVAGSEVINNIFVGNASSSYTPNKNVYYQNNLYYGNAGANDSGKLIADPKFINPGGYGAEGYRLKPDSPCIDSGITISSSEYDYFGTTINQSDFTDRGIHEFIDNKDVATFYDDSYSGNPISLDIGTYSTSQLVSSGINNNSLSSLILQPGIQVTAYDGDLNGTSWTYTSNTSLFASGNDMISSMVISKTASYPGTLGKSAIFYSDYFSGNAVNLIPGQYNLSQLQAKGINDNVISSIRVLPGIKVKIYVGDNFTGESGIITADTILNNTIFNNTITSIIVVYESQAINLALNATATADTYASTQTTPSAAIDNIVNTKWCSGGGTIHYLTLDLNSVYYINRWVVLHCGNAESDVYNTRDFKLQVSVNGTIWTDVDTVTGNTQNTTDRTFTTTAARYVRLYITVPAQNSDTQARIDEFQIYGPTDLSQNSSISSSSSQDGAYSPSFAIDNTLTTKWQSAAGSEQYITVDMQSHYYINSYVVCHAGVNESTTYNTKDFKLQISQDNISWTDIDNITSNTSNITERQINPTIGRYVRLYITVPTNTTDTKARIYELKLFADSHTNIGVLPDYFVETSTISTNAELSALGTSLLAGRNPVAETSYYGINQLNNPAYGSPSYITDGDVETRDNCCIYNALCYYAPDPTGYPQRGTLVFDCLQPSIIDKIFISFRVPSGNVMQRYQIFVGNDLESIYTSTPVLEYDNTALSGNQLFTFTDKPVGRYIMFKALTDDSPYWWEVAAYGNAFDSIVTGLSQTTVNNLGTSLIAGKSPSKVINWYEHIDPAAGDNVLNMTDGNISTRAYYAAMYYNGTRVDSGTITYLVAPGANINKILISSDPGGNAFKEYELYVADASGADLYAPANKVASYVNNNSSSVQLFYFAQSKYGRYFGIKFIAPSLYLEDKMARIHELAVYGTIGTPTMDYMDYGLSQAQVNALGTSIISATAPLAVINTYNQNPSAGENVLNMTDGNISSRDYYGAMFFNGSEANSGTITYDLGVDATINKVLVASDPGGNAFKEYELYVADVSGADLFALSNRVSAYVNSNSSSVQLTSFAQSKTGRYFGIRLIVPSLNTVDKMARIHEIGLYGLTGVIQLKNFKINADIISGITPGTTVLAFKTALNLRSDVTVELKKGLTVLTNSDLIGSATTMNVYINSVLSKTYTQLIYGDATGDGNIDVADLAVMKLHLLKSSELTGILKKAGSLTNSDKITISDLIAVKKHMLGILSISQNR